MYSLTLKRLFDLLVTIPALILLAPVLALIALLARLKLGAPVLFRQQRPVVGNACVGEGCFLGIGSSAIPVSIPVTGLPSTPVAWL